MTVSEHFLTQYTDNKIIGGNQAGFNFWFINQNVGYTDLRELGIFV